MKTFPYGNAGPYDPELVDLLVKAIREFSGDQPDILGLAKDVDFLNTVVDNINDIFGDKLLHDGLFHQSTRTQVCR